MYDRWDAVDHFNHWWNNLSLEQKITEVNDETFLSLRIQDAEDIWDFISEEQRMKLLTDGACRDIIISNEFYLEEDEQNFINIIDL